MKLFIFCCLCVGLAALIVLSTESPEQNWWLLQRQEVVRAIMLKMDVPAEKLDSLMRLPMLIAPSWPLPWDTIDGKIFIEKGTRYLLVSGDYSVVVEAVTESDMWARREYIYNMNESKK